MPFDAFVIPMTNLTAYSNYKHMKVDGVDDSFMRGIFKFVVFSLPVTLIITFLFQRLFFLLFKKKVSVYFRRYSFTACVLLQGLIEGNIPFFTYLFFRQSFVAFASKFLDKVFVAGAVVCFFVVISFVCCFYFLFYRYLKKKFGYFIYCYYRCLPSMVFLTIQRILRGVVRGVIHSCLHNQYKIEIVLLCVMEACLIVSAVWFEKKKKIFLTQLMFCLTLCYHFLFIILNLSLYVE